MTMTAFASVVGAFVTQLKSATPVSAHVFRARMRPIAQTWADAVVVRIVRAAKGQAVGEGVKGIWATGIAVECYARASADTEADLAVDALIDAVVTRLYANRTLSGLVGDIDLDRIDWDFGQDGDNTGCATLVFNVSHATAANSIH